MPSVPIPLTNNFPIHAMIKPPMLKAGDTLAVVSLSWGGAGCFPARYQQGKRQLEEAFGVTVVEMEHTLRPPEWVASNPRARAEDLMAAFADSSINGIISAIGGDESVRILPYLDLNIIRSNPKVFLGYSDTTVTHFACLRAGLTSFYGPTIMAGFAENGGLFPYMEKSIHKTLFSPDPVGLVEPNHDGWTVERLDWGNTALNSQKRKLNPPTGPNVLQGTKPNVLQGTNAAPVSGHLIGGCIEVLEMLKGTDFWPHPHVWDGALLFLETSEEEPPVDFFTRWIRNFGSQGILHRINGILLGRPGGSNLPLEDVEKYDSALIHVIRDELELTSLPIMTQMDFGHTDPMFTIPYGVKAELDCEKQTFKIVESAVSPL